MDEQGNVLDSHHRLKAAKELGLPDEAIPRVVRQGPSDEQKLEHVLRLNLLRRHLTREQKEALAVQLRQRGWTQVHIAAVLGVSQQTVSNWLRDVTKIGDVNAESGKPVLPSTITDTLGREQPARKPRRQPRSVREEPGAHRLVAPPAAPSPRQGGPVEAAASGISEATSSVPSMSQPVALASAGGASGPRLTVEATPVAGAAPAPKPEAAAPPAAPAPTESAEVWAYLRTCLPGRLPEPGPLDSEGYARAVAFEGAPAVLGRVVRELEEGRRVVGAWRRWREHHGHTKPPHEAVRVLRAAANHLEKALAWVGTGGSGLSPGRQVPKA